MRENSEKTNHLAEWRANHQDGESTEQRNPYQKWRDKNTRATAIGAFCMSCMGTSDPDNPNPGYRADIKACTATKCPLYAWRPYQ